MSIITISRTEEIFTFGKDLIGFEDLIFPHTPRDAYPALGLVKCQK
jgi:hypothetical protein